MEDFDLNALANGIVSLLGKKVEADAQIKSRQQLFDQQAYGVDAYGRIYPRGDALAGGLGSPLVVVGIGVAAVTLLVFALKN